MKRKRSQAPPAPERNVGPEPNPADSADSGSPSKSGKKCVDPSNPNPASTSNGNSPSIGLNLRVTGYCNQGGRKYMEDVFSVAYQQTEDEKDLEYAFFGIFDGHGGREAAIFAKEHLMDFIVRQKSFWSNDDETVLKAIHEGYVQTHQAMWKELEKWPRTASGLPSTAGTTASIAFIRRGKVFIGHVGDSAIILGEQDPREPENWICQALTQDHKPESVEESKRIRDAGGKVVCKSGVPRVVWNRPKMGHKGPVRRSTHIDEIPFLAVARSLGDLWSYNSEENVFVVSPEPDTFVYPIDISKHRCLILGTDGAWNMLTPPQAVRIVCEAEKSNEQHMLHPSSNRQWINPSKRLVDRAIERWNWNNLRADNTSIVTVMLDPPGPPRAQVLKRQRELAQQSNHHQIGRLNAQGQVISPGTSNVSTHQAVNADRGTIALVTNTTPDEVEPLRSSASATTSTSYLSSQPQGEAKSSSTTRTVENTKKEGISIISRFPNSKNSTDAQGRSIAHNPQNTDQARVLHDFPQQQQHQQRSTSTAAHGHQEGQPAAESSSTTSHLQRLAASVMAASSSMADSTSMKGGPFGHHDTRQQRSAFESNSDDIQCNVITSSSDDEEATSPLALPGKRIVVKKRFDVLKESSRLSRELSNLQIKNGPEKKSKARRNGSGGEKVPTTPVVSIPVDSDTENEEQEQNRTRQLRSAKKQPSTKGMKNLDQHCRKLNENIKHFGKKMVRKTSNLNQQVKTLQSNLSRHLRSSHLEKAPSNASPERKSVVSTPTRALRPRTPGPAARGSKEGEGGSLSSRKRKQLSSAASTSQLVTKSPRTCAMQSSVSEVRITKKKPIVATRSRTAKVLQLKRT